MGTPVFRNDSINPLNPETLTFFYQKLNDSLGAVPTLPPSPVSIETKAGVFVLQPQDAFECYDLLIKLDRSDNQRTARDGKITQSVAQEYVRTTSQPGVKIRFSEFRPSTLWEQNHQLLLQASKQKRVLERADPDSPEVGQGRLWEMSALATLSGLTPSLYQAAHQLCSPQSACSLNLARNGLGREAMISWSDLPGQEKLEGKEFITWDMAKTLLDERQTRTYVNHEHGHYTFRFLEKKKGKENLLELVSAWNQLSASQREAIEQFRTLYNRHPQPDYKSTLLYCVEEATDSYFLRYASGEAYASRKTEVENGIQQAIALDDRAFANRFMNPQKRMMAPIQLAMMVHSARSFGVETASLRTFIGKVETLLNQLGSTYVKMYSGLWNMMDVMVAYVQSEEFVPTFYEVVSAASKE